MTLTLTSRRACALAAAAASAAAFSAAAGDAHALVVTNTPNGLEIREPDTNTLNRVTLSLENGKYRVEMPEFGGRGINGGQGCTVTEPTNGRDVAICDRIVPKVTGFLGAQSDTFSTDPSFPDPIDLFTGLGNDSIQFGAGNDRGRGGSGGDSFRGGAGNDDLEGGTNGDALLGEAGNDLLTASSGQDRLFGGDGDDILTTDGRRGTIGSLVGGLGRDTFDGKGSFTEIDSRDGIAEEVVCGRSTARLVFGFKFVRKATVDLVDTPGDAGLIKSGCNTIDRAPSGEKTAARLSSKSLKLKRGRVALKLRCTTSKRCKGSVSLAVKGGGKAKKVRYSIKGKRTKTLRLALSAKAARKVTRKTRAATVRLSEKGVKGARGERTLVGIKR